MMNYEESSWRSVVKAMSWRVFATGTTVLIAYLITGEIEMAKKIGVIEFAAKIIIYYAHERFWNFVSFGKYKEKS